MEQFRTKLKHRMIAGIVYCVLVPVLAVTLHVTVGETMPSGFTLGFACGIAAVALVVAIQSARALRREEKIRALFIAETDERNQAISRNAASSGIQILLAGLSVAMLVGVYLNQTVFYTLLGTTLFLALTMILTKCYYRKKL